MSKSETDTNPLDRQIDRRNTSSTKWDLFAGTDTLPFWIADMDFAAPDFILDAIRERLDHGILGYTEIPESLVDATRLWYQEKFKWTLQPEWLVWLPGVVPGLNLAAQTLTAISSALPGEILVPTPVYYPFLSIAQHCGLQERRLPLTYQNNDWRMDLEAWSDGLENDGRPRMLMLCNPQNPTGRIYRHSELSELSDWCLRHDIFLCSDEVHCSLLLKPNSPHVPIASLNPDLAKRSITLFAPTKTYNMPGLSCALAIIPDSRLRQRFKEARRGLIQSPGPLAYAAAEAAFRDRSDWVENLVAYLRGNESLLQNRLGSLNGVIATPVEATYMAWLDVRGMNQADPGRYFEQFGLGLSDGDRFGAKGFVRFNFGCPRSLLEQGLSRFVEAVTANDQPLRS